MEEPVQLFSRPRKKQRIHAQPVQPDREQPACEQPAAPSSSQQPTAAEAPHQEHQAAARSFKQLGVSDWLISVLGSLGMRQPTPVQAGVIPAILAGRDVIGTAQTGSGKTAAFALPILQQLARDPFGVFVLVLTPTRELAMQLADQFRALGAGMSLKDAVVIGGLDASAQAKALARRPHVVVATPGRLAALLEADSSLGAGFSRLRYLVLDEADRLLDSSFEADLRLLLAALPAAGRQTLLFSATLTASLVKLQRSSLQDAFVFKAYEGLRTADGLDEQYCFIPAKVKDVYLYYLLTHSVDALAAARPAGPGAAHPLGDGSSSSSGTIAGGGGRRVRSAIVFVSTCKGCAALSQLLKELGLPAAALHSGKSQAQRLAALQSFKSELVPLLLATDVASRGLDIPSVDLVVNYDLPVLPADYVHRVGRTARAGRGGWALSFITQYDVALVTAIEGHIGHKLAEHAMDEALVLRSISRVYSAKKAAALALLAQDDRAAAGGGGRGQQQRSTLGSRHRKLA